MKREARIVAAHRRSVLSALNGLMPSWVGVDRVVIMVPPNSGQIVSLLSRVGRVIEENYKADAQKSHVHTRTLALRFEADGNDRWRVTIVRTRFGREGFTLRVGLSAEGRWELR